MFEWLIGFVGSGAVFALVMVWLNKKPSPLTLLYRSILNDIENYSGEPEKEINYPHNDLIKHTRYTLKCNNFTITFRHEYKSYGEPYRELEITRNMDGKDIQHLFNSWRWYCICDAAYKKANKETKRDNAQLIWDTLDSIK